MNSEKELEEMFLYLKNHKTTNEKGKEFFYNGLVYLDYELPDYIRYCDNFVDYKDYCIEFLESIENNTEELIDLYNAVKQFDSLYNSL